jgi:hypothetical protein
MERLNPSRRETVKDVAYELMERAYLKVSDRGTLPANARQIMYAARNEIQERTGKQLNDQYFTQGLLPDYIAEHDVDWDVTFDDRGHLREPHTGHTIGLGTLAVREYLQRISEPELVGPELSPAHVATRGPGGAMAVWHSSKRKALTRCSSRSSSRSATTLPSCQPKGCRLPLRGSWSTP